MRFFDDPAAHEPQDQPRQPEAETDGRIPAAVNLLAHTARFRIRYSETDQMGTFYNSRPLEWFEYSRTELLRHHGMPYTDIESRGVFLPVVEAHVNYLGRARYDDLIEIHATASLHGRARLRCTAALSHAGSGRPVAEGYTVHVFVDREGRPLRPPPWFIEFITNPRSPVGDE